jgi:hypothetical protein
MPWTPISPTGTAWSPAALESEDWLEPSLTPLLTESGVRILAENGNIICTEEVNLPPRPWVTL